MEAARASRTTPFFITEGRNREGSRVNITNWYKTPDFKGEILYERRKFDDHEKYSKVQC